MSTTFDSIVKIDESSYESATKEAGKIYLVPAEDREALYEVSALITTYSNSAIKAEINMKTVCSETYLTANCEPLWSDVRDLVGSDYEGTISLVYNVREVFRIFFPLAYRGAERRDATGYCESSTSYPVAAALFGSSSSTADQNMFSNSFSVIDTTVPVWRGPYSSATSSTATNKCECYISTKRIR